MRHLIFAIVLACGLYGIWRFSDDGTRASLGGFARAMKPILLIALAFVVAAFATAGLTSIGVL